LEGHSGGGCIVHRLSANAGKLVLACFMICGFSAQPSLEMSLSTESAGSSTASPAEIVASRFPSPDATSPTVPATFSTARVMPMEHWEVFNQSILSSSVTANPLWPTDGQFTEPAVSETAQEPVAALGAAKPEPKAQTPVPVPRRGTARSDNVLNDAQIASIKRRLRLTAEQEQMWPAVEAALRKIVYTKGAMNPAAHVASQNGARMAYIDPGSAEIQQLKYAALPLILRLNDEQKREVKMLAYVMGLESLASQF
jgi:hypothetical protein